MAKRALKKMDPRVETHQSDLAMEVLATAQNEVAEKSAVHGDTVNSFAMAAELWTTYVRNVAIMNGQTIVRPHDVAQMMALLKMTRSVYGDSPDNFVDGAGYTALASMLQMNEEE